MGSNVSRHAGKRGQAGGAGAGGPGAGLAGRRALSSGSLCNGHNHKGGASARAAVPGSENGAEHGERAKLCGSLPNHLDGSDDGVGVGGAGELAGPDRNGGLELRLQPLRPAPAPPSPAPAPQPLYAPAPPLAAMASLAPTPTPALTPAPTPPPSLSPQPPPHAVSVCVTELYPFITPEATFAVALARGPRGLGLSLAGGAEDARDAWPGLVRVKRLFPQQPAWACGRLRQGDILLAANGGKSENL
ncbi:Uncharacterized protein GBIM_11375 [Gryllus bimaculatus]|nr:Uncharacterized protein GBIM_11375 [Gryllus bimaculatus]